MKRLRQSHRLVRLAAPIVASALALIATRPDAGGAAEGQRFGLTSAAFTPGATIPARFTADGDNHSPPLVWQHAPPQTRQFAVVMEDIDRGDPPWAHWVLYNLSARTSELPAGLPKEAMLEKPVRGAHGLNSWTGDGIGYRGPEPDPADPPHRYRFRLYALSAKLDLPPGLPRDGLLRRLEGHVLATTELVGTYDR